MKSYRDKELKNYIIANVLVYILLNNNVVGTLSVEFVSSLQFFAELLNLAVVSSSIYIFAFVLDSVYSGDFKRKLVYIATPEPGQVIFDKILKNNTRFSTKDAKGCYKEIYKLMPSKKNEIRVYQNQNWYRIYHKYKSVEMVSVAAKDFRLCRDMFISTLNILIIYIVLCFIADSVSFSWYYLGFLFIMLIISNIAARNKGRKWVYNVIAHDISEMKNKKHKVKTKN